MDLQQELDTLACPSCGGRRAIRLSDGMLKWRLSDLPVEAGAPA
ncbi:hypothetical protein ACFQYP_19655 [Nonomuraea antimicrobica]